MKGGLAAKLVVAEEGISSEKVRSGLKNFQSVLLLVRIIKPPCGLSGAAGGGQWLFAILQRQLGPKPDLLNASGQLRGRPEYQENCPRK